MLEAELFAVFVLFAVVVAVVFVEAYYIILTLSINGVNKSKYVVVLRYQTVLPLIHISYVVTVALKLNPIWADLV